MSEQTPPNTPVTPVGAAASQPASSKREGVVPLWALGLSLLLLVALGVASFLMLQRMRALESELHRRVEVVGEQAAQATRATEQEAAGIAGYGTRLSSQEVQLAGDAKLALSALSGAEARLARVDTGRYLPLRRAMANDMERLRRAPMADLSGQALRIDTLLSVVDGLPLAFERSPARGASTAAAGDDKGAEPTQAQRLARAVWEEVRQLVRIERLDRPDPALLSPEHSFFLRENLKLRLINARVALLQRNGAVWREDIRLAREWIERYYDTRARQTENALVTLRQLAAVDPGEALPGLNESMSALAQLKAQRQRPTVTREEKR